MSANRIVAAKYGATYIDKFIDSDSFGREDARSFLLSIDARDPESVDQYMDQVIYGRSTSDKRQSQTLGAKTMLEVMRPIGKR